MVNSLILRTQDIAMFAEDFSDFSLVSLRILSQISEIGAGEISSWAGNTHGICK